MKSLFLSMVFRAARVLVVCSLAASTIYSQSDSALGFFTLHVGDVRQYHYYYYVYCLNQSFSTFYTERVVADTILPTGFQYKIVESNRYQAPPRRYLRVDTTNGNVYEYSGSPSQGDYLVDSLRATKGSAFRHGNYGVLIQCIGVDTAIFLGRHTLLKRFNVLLIGGSWTYSLAYGFGFATMTTSSEDQCYPVWNTYVTDLTYARIDNQEYGTFVGVSDRGQTMPSTFTLEQNYPNPFNPNTTIRYTLPRADWVTMSVFNVLGQDVANLVNENQQAGSHEIDFQANGLASGIYLYRLQAGGFVATRAMLLLK